MSVAVIRGLLQARLETVSGLPFHFKENTRYAPVPTTPYVRSTLLPAETVQHTGLTDGIRGLFQLDVCFPQGRGTTDADAAAQAIKATFARGTELTGSGVRLMVKMSWIEVAQTEGQFYCLPVLVRWEALLPKA